MQNRWLNGKMVNGNKGSLCIVKKDGGNEGVKKVYGVVGGQLKRFRIIY
jgi:hypothetical protein